MRLPNGNSTENENEYIKAWQDIAQPIADGTRTKLCAFDPDIRLYDADTGFTVQLPLWFVKNFNRTRLAPTTLIVT